VLREDRYQKMTVVIFRLNFYRFMRSKMLSVPTLDGTDWRSRVLAVQLKSSPVQSPKLTWCCPTAQCDLVRKWRSRADHQSTTNPLNRVDNIDYSRSTVERFCNIEAVAVERSQWTISQRYHKRPTVQSVWLNVYHKPTNPMNRTVVLWWNIRSSGQVLL
jgi:hypothetical protein